METATLAAIAPGRVVLGLRESVEIVRRLLNGERVTYAGELFAVNDVKLEAPPPSRVPIMLGVKGPRALALAPAETSRSSRTFPWPCPTTGPGPASGCDRSSRTTWGCSTASRSWKTQESRRPAHSRPARPSSRDAPPL